MEKHFAVFSAFPGEPDDWTGFSSIDRSAADAEARREARRPGWPEGMRFIVRPVTEGPCLWKPWPVAA